jgi:hypothetical protein
LGHYNPYPNGLYGYPGIFAGKLDEFGIWDKELSKAEVLSSSTTDKLGVFLIRIRIINNMSIYYDKQVPGEIWLRDLGNNVTAGNKVLSSIFLKYKNINETFYSELTSNKINRFDVIFDTIFIETTSGFIFEKFYVDSGSIVPFNQINFFNFRKNTTVDYWYSENKNKIFFTEIAYVLDLKQTTNGSIYKFYFSV